MGWESNLRFGMELGCHVVRCWLGVYVKYVVRVGIPLSPSWDTVGMGSPSSPSEVQTVDVYLSVSQSVS
jgi:hypothetical protein